MNDIISRNIAIKAIVDLPNCYNGFSDTFDKACIIGVLEELAPIDAVQVVRCKDCKFWMKNPYRESSVFGLCFKHKDIAIATDETDWCSWAERKEEES